MDGSEHFEKIREIMPGADSLPNQHAAEHFEAARARGHRIVRAGQAAKLLLRR